MFWALRDGNDEGVTETPLNDTVKQLRMAAAPVLEVLSRQERAAVTLARIWQ